MTATLDPTTTATFNNGATRISDQAALLRQEWADDPRWAGIERSYSAEDVVRLRGTVQRGAHAGPPRRRAAVGRAAHQGPTPARWAR